MLRCALPSWTENLFESEGGSAARVVGEGEEPRRCYNHASPLANATRLLEAARRKRARLATPAKAL